MRRYLDYNATAPMRPEVADLIDELLELPQNASSIHAEGRKARQQLEKSRETLAHLLSCWPNELTFTATGTEANNLALHNAKGKRLIVSAIEHPSVLKASDTVEIVRVDESGVISLEHLVELLASGEQETFISVMLANNETGVIQPIADIAKLAKQYNAVLHTDAVQAFGKIPVDFTSLGVDMMSISAHKLGGPQGAAALLVRNNYLEFEPLLKGGRQELGRRAGTENIPAIAGFALAAELSQRELGMHKLRNWLRALEDEMELEAPERIVASKLAQRLPNTTCVTMPGVSSETQLMSFDLDGFAVSAGSACSSGRVEASHVLKAMGLSEEVAKTAIRISGGWNTTEEDIKALAAAWKKLYSKSRNEQNNGLSKGISGAAA